MMTVSEILNQTWKMVVAEEPASAGYYHRRIPLAGVWPVHAGIHSPKNARVLILETELELVRKLSLRDVTKGYSIDVCPDEAGRRDRAAIWVQETDLEYREIFTIFCADILEHWISHADANASLKSLSHRLCRWQKFFQRGSRFGLSREDYVGLYGELCFMEAALNAGASSVSIVGAWQAPLGTNQDFLFGPLAVEVKTTSGNEIDKVRINNARQLDRAGLQNLFLARYSFDFRQGSGRTLPQLVRVLKAAFALDSAEALSVFNDSLLEAGFLESTQNEFDLWGFTLRRFDVFNVGEGFPCLVESSLPSGVSEISYVLNLAAASQFQIPDSEFWRIMISCHG